MCTDGRHCWCAKGRSRGHWRRPTFADAVVSLAALVVSVSVRGYRSFTHICRAIHQDFTERATAECLWLRELTLLTRNVEEEESLKRTWLDYQVIPLHLELTQVAVRGKGQAAGARGRENG